MCSCLQMRNAFKIIEIPLNNTRPNTNTHIHTHLDMVNDMKNDTNQVNVPLFSIATTEKKWIISNANCTQFMLFAIKVKFTQPLFEEPYFDESFYCSKWNFYLYANAFKNFQLRAKPSDCYLFHSKAPNKQIADLTIKILRLWDRMFDHMYLQPQHTWNLRKFQHHIDFGETSIVFLFLKI